MDVNIDYWSLWNAKCPQGTSQPDREAAQGEDEQPHRRALHHDPLLPRPQDEQDHGAAQGGSAPQDAAR